MLYDLNIAWSPGTTSSELDRTLRFSASLGYDVVALNHTIGAPIPPVITNPLPQLDPPPPSQQETTTTAARYPGAILRRVTMVLTESAQHHRLPQLATNYDIVAVRPATEESFNAACGDLGNIALISLDLTERLPAPLRPTPCMAAVKRGVRFEVCYSQALQGPSPVNVMAGGKAKSPAPTAAAAAATTTTSTSEPHAIDARKRAQFIGNLTTLIRVTRGRGIVISSEAQSALGIRAPADVVNLMNVWGLSTDRATEGLGALPRGVVVNEGIRRSGFRGVVDIVGLATRPDRPKADDVDMADAGSVVPIKGNKNKKSQQAAKKRKQSDMDGGNAQSAGAAATGDVSGEQPQMSKRQVKKIQTALRKKQREEGEQQGGTAKDTKASVS